MKSVSMLSIKITVFVCGAIVMIFEIVGSRILAPYIGTSTYTWTSLIGIILAALSLGYWIGGNWADQKPSIGALASAIFIAGGLVATTVLIHEPVLSLLAAASLPLEISSVIAALILFAPASVCLGFVTPYAIKLSIKSIDSTGKTVGNLYAISTVGSIFGTFLAGFFLIPFVGSTRTLYILSAALVSISLLLTPFAISNAKTGLIALLLLGIVFNEGRALALYSERNYHDIDTEYNRVRIFDTKKDGRPLRAMAIDPYIFQSSMFLDDGTSGAQYTRLYHLVDHFKPELQTSLMIGGAGYQFPREYLERYPDARMDVVEIDPGMTRLAKKHFRLKETPRMSINHIDGRVFLNQARANYYDAVFIDAFNSLFSVPFQLTTLEAVREINRSLKTDGVVIVNIGSAIEGDGSLFLKSEAATYSKVFRSVRFYQVDQSKNPGIVQNVVLIAGNRPLSKGPASKINQKLLDHEITVNYDNARPLTDELAPVERYNSIAQNYTDR